jgi:hypothetical protein
MFAFLVNKTDMVVVRPVQDRRGKIYRPTFAEVEKFWSGPPIPTSTSARTSTS